MLRVAVKRAAAASGARGPARAAASSGAAASGHWKLRENKNPVTRVFKALHPPSEVADLAMERAALLTAAPPAGQPPTAGLQGGSDAKASDAKASAAVRRVREVHTSVVRGTVVRGTGVPGTVVRDGGPDLRLETLTSLSRSHGVHWDELDEIFFKFLDERETRNAHWQRQRETMAEKADGLALRGEAGDAGEARMRAGPLRRQRLAKLTAWSRKNLEFFKPEDLHEILNDVVSNRVVQREIHERTY